MQENGCLRRENTSELVCHFHRATHVGFYHMKDAVVASCKKFTVDDGLMCELTLVVLKKLEGVMRGRISFLETACTDGCLIIMKVLHALPEDNGAFAIGKDGAFDIPDVCKKFSE